LLSRPDHPDAEFGPSWEEQVPPPGRDATLLAVVPIPGTGTSLAIVGYAIATADGQTHPQMPVERIGGPGLFLDHAQRQVWAGGEKIALTFQEFELLAFLSAHPATVFSRAELVEQLWRRAPGRDVRAVARDSRTVDVHVSPTYGQCLVTEYRVGYQFRPLA
jgi:DNA-binding response OmpR family regulator